METSLAESQTDSYFPTKWPNGYIKQKDVSDTHIQRQTITNKQIPWGIYVPRLIFIWGVKNGKINQRTTGPVSNT